MTDPESSSSDRYTNPSNTDVWAADAAAQGKTGTQQLLAVETGSPPAAVRTALRLRAEEKTVLRKRLILLDGQPVELALSYYPARIAAGTPLAENKKIKGGAVRVLAEAGYPLDESTECVTADRPTKEEAEILHVDANEPLLVIFRTGGPAGSPPAECAVNRMVASRVAPLEYRLRTTPQ